MSDLISRKAAIEAIEEYLDRLQMVNWQENPGVPYKAHALNWCVNTIRDLPSAEPEQVIRCKDCKHRAVVRDPDRVGGFGLEFPDDECPCNCDDPFYAFRPADDWYCARGEKKETKTMSDPISRRVTIDDLPYTYPKLTTNSQQSCNRLATDYISRQDAIDAPEKFTKDCNPEHFVGNQKFIEFMDSDEIRSFGKWQFANGFNMGLTAVEVAINKLPSAEPEWIPVSERLPKVGETVIAQCSANIIETLKVDSKGDWYHEVGRCYPGGFVIAWKPLPEPYVDDDHE